jgi:hypothetical protein
MDSDELLILDRYRIGNLSTEDAEKAKDFKFGDM